MPKLLSLLSCILVAAFVAVSPSFAQEPMEKTPTAAEQAIIDAASQPGLRYFRIVAKHSGKCLEIADYSYANGAAVVQNRCNNSDNQKFALTPAADGTYSITAKHSGLVVELGGWQGQNGATINQWELHGGTNQRWRLVQADGDYFYILSYHSEKALDVAGVRKDDGTPLVQWSLYGGWNQRFRFVPVR
jgi:hypothetical protein